MSIYRLYIQNGNRAGFWIQHRSWQNLCAQVQTIAGRVSGGLEGTALNQAVHVLCFDVRSGRVADANGMVDRPEDSGFVMIAEPPWHRRPERQAARRTALIS